MYEAKIESSSLREWRRAGLGICLLAALASTACAGRKAPTAPPPAGEDAVVSSPAFAADEHSDDGGAEPVAGREPASESPDSPEAPTLASAPPAPAAPELVTGTADAPGGAAPSPGPATGDAAAGGGGEAAASEEEKASLRDLCRNGERPNGDEPMLDTTRRRLQETFCGATLWFDGLLGGQPDLENARAVSGRVEITALHSDYEGFDPKVRLRLNYDLPTLERRLTAFVGRDDEEDFVRDRREGPVARSALFGLESQSEDRWLAGLGYRPPGNWLKRFDFSVGGKLRSAPEIFVQARWKRQYFVGERSVWRIRETGFWQNREGFGSTTNIDFDHVLNDRLLLRWSNAGTITEESDEKQDGFEWRSNALAYRALEFRGAALGAEVFVRGATEREVPIREYGTQFIYREPMFRKWFFAELIAGYSWPREHLDEEREGSLLIGAGIELHFGQNPY